MIIAITNQKGGVAKTTTAVSLSAALNRLGKRVLLVDADPQGSASISLSLEPSKLARTLFESLTQKEKLPCYKYKENFYIVPSNIRLSMIDTVLSREADRTTRLKAVLEPLKSCFDYIIIDCPPSFGLINTSVLLAVDGVIVPLKAEALSLAGFRDFLQIFFSAQEKNAKLQIIGIVLTQYKGRLHNSIILRCINQMYRNKLFSTYIRENIKLSEASYAGKDIFSYDKQSIGAADYMSLSKELIERTAKHR